MHAYTVSDCGASWIGALNELQESAFSEARRTGWIRASSKRDASIGHPHEEVQRDVKPIV